MSKEIMREHDSGIITIQGSVVVWHSEDLVFSKFDLNDVAVIGEYTNSHGPWFDDWFLTFVLKNSENFSIPFYASNIQELLSLLALKFDQSLTEGSLANSTIWRSVVRYPKSIAGKELFTPSSACRAANKNLFRRFLDFLGLRNRKSYVKYDLSDDVRSEIQSSYA